MRFEQFPIAVLMAFLAIGCGDAGEETDEAAPGVPAPPSSEVAESYAPELEVDLSAMTRSGSGLYSRTIAEGSGEPAETGDTVVVHYTGWLASGEKFDSSRDRGQPFETAIGVGRVIDGWDEAVVGMRPGERRLLVIPPALGYGNDGRGMIPGGATLVFDVELLEVR